MIEQQKLLVLKIINELGLKEVLDKNTLPLKSGVNPETLDTVRNELANSGHIKKTVAGDRITQNGKDFLLRLELNEPVENDTVNPYAFEVTQDKIIEYLKRGSIGLSKASGDEEEFMHEFLVKNGLMTLSHKGTALLNNEGQAFIRNSYYFNPVPLTVFDWKINIIEQLKGGQTVLKGDGDLQRQALLELRQDGIVDQEGSSIRRMLTSKGRQFVASGLSYNDFLYGGGNKPFINIEHLGHKFINPVNTIVDSDNVRQSLKVHDINNANNSNTNPQTMSVTMKWILATSSALVAALVVWWLTK